MKDIRHKIDNFTIHFLYNAQWSWNCWCLVLFSFLFIKRVWSTLHLYFYLDAHLLTSFHALSIAAFGFKMLQLTQLGGRRSLCSQLIVGSYYDKKHTTHQPRTNLYFFLSYFCNSDRHSYQLLFYIIAKLWEYGPCHSKVQRGKQEESDNQKCCKQDKQARLSKPVYL